MKGIFVILWLSLLSAECFPVFGFVIPGFPESFSGRMNNMSYQIATAEQLDMMKNFRESCFIQIADIDLGISPWNLGMGWQLLGISTASPFTGSYQGNGYKILN